MRTCWMDLTVVFFAWCWCLVRVSAAVSETFYTSAALSCGNSFASARLDNMYTSMDVSSKIHCAYMCFMDARCVSFNVDESRGRCELNEVSFQCGDLVAPASGYTVFQEGSVNVAITTETTTNALTTQANPVNFSYLFMVRDVYVGSASLCGTGGPGIAGVLANLRIQSVYELAKTWVDVVGPTQPNSDCVWVGAEDMDNDGIWLWNDGTEFTSAYPHLHSDVSWPPTNQCICMWAVDGINFGKLTSQDCNDGNTWGLCQIPPA